MNFVKREKNENKKRKEKKENSEKIRNKSKKRKEKSEKRNEAKEKETKRKLQAQGPCAGHRSIIAILRRFSLVHEKYTHLCRLNFSPTKIYERK